MSAPIDELREAANNIAVALVPDPTKWPDATSYVLKELQPLVTRLAAERDGANEILDAVIVGFDRALSRIIVNDPVGAERELKLAIAQMDNPTKTGESYAQLRERCDAAERELASAKNAKQQLDLRLKEHRRIFFGDEIGLYVWNHDPELTALRADKALIDALEYDANGNSVGYVTVIVPYPPTPDCQINGSFVLCGPQGGKVREVIKQAVEARDKARTAIAARAAKTEGEKT